MSITSIAPYFILMALFIMLGTLLMRLPFFAASSQSLAASRYEALDGLRGYLALTVFIHHAVARYFYEANGVWEYPHSIFYTISPQAAVAVFFMITGFLFWLKVIRAGGKLNYSELFIGRAKRLAPLYLTAVLLLFALVGFKTHWTRVVPTKELLAQVAKWFGFNFFGMPDLNGITKTWTMIAGVFWTLQYEWIFTLALPFMACFYKGWRFAPLFLAAMLFWKFSHDQLILANFLFGMAAAYTISYPKLTKYLRHPMSGLVAISALLILFGHFQDTFGLKQTALLFIFFTIIVNGNDLFGLLRLPASKYLGAVSYSLYLLHGMILYISFRAAQHFQIRLSPIHFWLLVMLAGVCSVLLSGVTYKFIEAPFMRRRIRKEFAPVISPETAQ